MKPRISPPPVDEDDEVAALIETLHVTGERLEVLTAGEVDTVADRQGRTFLLRHAQEDARHREAARQAAILNALPAHVALLDRQGLIISVNEAWRAFGAANGIQGPGYEIGLDYLEICDRARADESYQPHKVAAGIRSVLGGAAKSFSLEYHSHSPTEQRCFLLTVTPLAHDPPMGAVVMHLDVTAERQAAGDLRRSETFKGAIIESSLDCLITIDHEGKIVEFNPAAQTSFGFTRAQVLGKDMVELLVPARYRDAHRRGFAHYLATGEGPILGKRMELEAMRADGAEFPIELAITAIGTPEMPLFTAFIRDITARKASQGKIRRLNRVFAVLSGINTLIVRVHEREELFNEACRIVVEQGNFGMAWIGMLDAATQDVTPVAWAGESAEGLTRAKSSARADMTAGQGAVGRAIRERRPVFNNDINTHTFGGPRVKEIVRLGFRSQITLPLFEDQTVVGTLTMYAGEPGFFDEEEVRLLTELAGNISLALEHIARQQKIEKLSRVRAVLSAVNSAIARTRDRRQLLAEACRVASKHGNFRMAWVGMLDRTDMTVRAAAWSGLPDEFMRQVRMSVREAGPVGQGTTPRAVRSKQPAWDNDFTANPDMGYLRRRAIDLGARSMITLPLLVEGEVDAVFSLYADEAGFFTEDEIKVMEEMASDVSFALQSIARQEKLEKLSRTRAVSSGIRSALVRVRNWEELFQESCRIAVEDGQFPFAWIGVFDPVTQDVTPTAWSGESSEKLTGVKSSVRHGEPGARGTVGRAIRERRPIVNNDITANNFGGPRVKEILRMGFRSQITLPLFEDQTVVGALTMYVREADFFDEEEIGLLGALAGDISFALEHMNRQQKIVKLSRIRAVSSGINAAIVRIRERKALLEEVCRVALENGKFEMIWIGSVDQDKQRVEPIAWTGFSEKTVHATNWANITDLKGTLHEAIQTRKVTVRNDVTAEMPGGRLRQEALKHGCQSSVCLPLVLDDTVTALVVLFARGRGFFDKDELALLEGVASDISFALQAIDKQEKLEFLSYYDVLTGLPNRSLFVDRLSQQMRSRGGEPQMVAVILLDLDRFRNINGLLGHRGGDEILDAIAQRLGHAFHGKDYLARISSNGFGVIVRGMKDAAGVVHLVENEIFSCFKEPFVVSDRELRVSVKAGIAMFPVDGDQAEVLFGNAESALRRAKASSDRFLFYASAMNSQAAHAIALETRLRKAVEDEQFVLHYQPKVELATGRICGVEALIRWNDPTTTGLVPPGEFIPVLEETGLILEVGAWALQQAVSDHARWVAQGLQPPRIAVNVSQIQLRHAGFVAMVADATSAHTDGAAGLELEITESLFMENFDDCVEKLAAIRDMGIEIAVDDFGTGYSSLSYISRLPVDALKIDRSFISKMADEADSMSIVSMVVTLAHALNLKVIAEGVETAEQSNTLKLLRCDEAQGYLFARPLPRESIEALLRERSGTPNRARRELRPRALT